MKQKRFLFLFTFLAFLPFISQAQTLEDLTKNDKNYQSCLDRGTNMLDCSQLYYSQIDSLLNLAYNKLKKPLNQSGKAVLKNEQLKWLGKRDAYFKKVDKENAAENRKSFFGNDRRMIAIDDKAQFVRKRVEVLINNQSELTVINILGAKVYEEPTFDSKTLTNLPVGETIKIDRFIESQVDFKVGKEFSLAGKWIKPKGIDGFIFSSDLTDKKVEIGTDKFGQTFIDLRGNLIGEKSKEKQMDTPMGKFPKYYEYKYYDNGQYTYIEWDGCFDHIYEYKNLSINEVYHQMVSDYIILMNGNEISIPAFLEKADNIIKFEGEGATQDLTIEYNETESIIVSSYDCN